MQQSVENAEIMVVSPCGRCRELLIDYGDMMVIVQGTDHLHKVRASELLPYKYDPPEGSHDSLD